MLVVIVGAGVGLCGEGTLVVALVPNMSLYNYHHLFPIPLADELLRGGAVSGGQY